MKIQKRENRRDRIKRKIKEEISKAYRHKRLIVGIISFLLVIAIYLFKDSSSITLRYSTFIGLVIAFYILDYLFDVRFHFKHYFFIIVIGVSGLMLSHLYFIHPQYDKIQHFILPIMLCSIFFFMVNKLKLALKWKITFTVLSIAGLLGIFEIGEYILDLLFNFRLQGVYLRDLTGLEKFNLLLNPLDDTMVDLSFGILGSSLYALYAWFKYSKYHRTR
ncbi:MAG: hypothetical protein AABX23_01140 [Nanoarchaeota archaeon]